MAASQKQKRKRLLLLIVPLTLLIYHYCSSSGKNTYQHDKMYFIFVDTYYLMSPQKVLALKNEIISLLSNKEGVTPMSIEIYPLDCESSKLNSISSYSVSKEQADNINDGSFVIKDTIISNWGAKPLSFDAKNVGCNKIIDSFKGIQSLLDYAFNTSNVIKILYITDWYEVAPENNISDFQFRLIGNNVSDNGNYDFDDEALLELTKSLKDENCKANYYCKKVREKLNELKINDFQVYWMSSNSLGVNKKNISEIRLNKFWDGLFEKGSLKKIQIRSLKQFFEN
ncbi:MAG: hypothetical protein GC192_11535 [Bacteroidetes bacterium]|nr:hypothetical protein [Bacteroidota bacterium]